MTRKTNERLQWLIGGIGMLALIGVIVYLATSHSPAPDPRIEVGPDLFKGADGKFYATGRVADSEETEAFRAQQPAKWFGDTPAGKVRLAPGEKTVILPNAAKQALGHFLPARNQGQVGSCVSFGTATAIEHLQCVQIAGGAALDYADVVQEEIYGGSRVQIGKGKIRGDGSVGAWAAQFVQQWGIVARGKYGSVDLSTYSESRCRQWGKSGVPADIETLAKKSPVKGITGIRNAEEARTALAQGYPIAVCSDQGFTEKRDKDGFLKASGQWGHCMACLGYTDTPRKGFLICNSWGADWVSGPAGPYPIPDGCFWCEEKTFDHMCKENDTWAFSDATGFPAQNTDPWWIAAPVPRDDVVSRPLFAPFARKDFEPCYALAP